MIDYAALKTELTTDPVALGYAARIATGDDAGLAALLSTVGAVTGETVTVNAMTPQAFAEALVETEFAALTTQQCLYQVLLAICSAIDPNAANVKAGVLAIYAAGTQTRANLAAALTRPCSRAESLFGAGTVLSALDIARAFGRGG